MTIYLKIYLTFLIEIEGMPIPVEVKAGVRSIFHSEYRTVCIV